MIKKSLFLGIIVCVLVTTAVSGQTTTCIERYDDFSFTQQQNFIIEDNYSNAFQVIDVFTKEYLLLVLNDYECQDCLDDAKGFESQGLQSYFTADASCSYGSVVGSGKLSDRQQSVGSGFIASNSYQLVDDGINEIPQYFGSSTAQIFPVYLMIDRQGEVLRRAEGGLPVGLIQETCVVQDQCVEQGYHLTSISQSSNGSGESREPGGDETQNVSDTDNTDGSRGESDMGGPQDHNIDEIAGNDTQSGSPGNQSPGSSQGSSQNISQNSGGTSSSGSGGGESNSPESDEGQDTDTEGGNVSGEGTGGQDTDGSSPLGGSDEGGGEGSTGGVIQDEEHQDSDEATMDENTSGESEGGRLPPTGGTGGSGGGPSGPQGPETDTSLGDQDGQLGYEGEVEGGEGTGLMSDPAFSAQSPRSSNGGTGEPGSAPPTGEQPQGILVGDGSDGGSDGRGNGRLPEITMESEAVNPDELEQQLGRIQIEIPREAERDVVTNESILTTANSRDAVRITFRQINRWLWIVFGASILAGLVYAGFRFITAAGDPEKTKSALMTFVYIGVAFGIALFAFVIVRLVANLFV